MGRTASLSLLLVAAAFAGCDDTPSSATDAAAPDGSPAGDAATGVDSGQPDAAGGPDVGTPIDGPTWHGAVRGLFEQHCNVCHRAGGVAPFDFTHDDAAWAAGAPAWAGPAVAAVEDDRMPPWPPDPACRPVRHARSMPAEARQTVLAWRDGGFPVGDPADYVAPPPVDDGEDARPPDLILRPAEGYVPDTERLDDYRCLPLAHTFERDTWVTRSRAVPDRTDVVHHVVVYLIGPDGAEDVDWSDAQTRTPGYRCFGDAGVYPASAFTLWAPGARDEFLPEGAAMLVPAGSRLVMQVHYNAATSQAPDVADLSALHLWTLPEGEQPTSRVDVVNFADLWLAVPPGAEDHEVGQDFRLAGDGRIIAVAPHMHLLGQRIRADLVRADGSEHCLVDIPRWDFQWQSAYFFEDDHVVDGSAGDTLRLRCGYDNSEAAQPIIDGQARPAERVRWGDGTYDEMCLVFAFVERPVDQPYDTCAGATECIRGCDHGDADCLYRCMAAGGVSCLICGANEWNECAFDRGCPDEIVRLVGCINSTRPCGAGACVVEECLEESDAILDCSHDLLLEGGCNDYTAYCGLAF